MVATYAQRIDEQEAVRRRAQAATEAHARHAPPVGSSPPAAAAALAYSGLRGRGSGPLRAALLRAQQQTYGNRAVARFLQSAAGQRPAANGPAPDDAQEDRTTPQSDTPAFDPDLASDVAHRLGIPAAVVGTICRVWGGSGPLAELRDILARGPWLLAAAPLGAAAASDAGPELAPADLAAALDAVIELRDGVQLAAQVGQLNLPSQDAQDLDTRLQAVIERLQDAWERMQVPPAGGPRDAVVTAARGELGKVIARGGADEGVDADDKQRRKLRYGSRALDLYFRTAVGEGHYDRETLLHKLAFGEKDTLPRWGGVFALWAYKQAGMGAVGPWRLGENILTQPGFRAIQQLNPPYSKPRKGDIGLLQAEQRHFVVAESPWDTNPNAKEVPIKIIEGDATSDSLIEETQQDVSDAVFFSAEELARS